MGREGERYIANISRGPLANIMCIAVASIWVKPALYAQYSSNQSPDHCNKLFMLASADKQPSNGQVFKAASAFKNRANWSL
jgi:hypothetical protein